MNKHLDKYLCDKYPKIFADRNKSPQKTCMHWGFSHGEGWFFLIDTLCSCIQHHINNPPYVYRKTLKVYAIRTWNSFANLIRLPYRFQIYGDLMIPGNVPQVVAAQVKEKFGGLRFYFNGGNRYIQGMVAIAEAMSYRICEECGQMNEFVNPNSDGWIKSTCVSCSRDRKSHTANRDTELIALWELVRLETLHKTNKNKVSDKI